MRNSKSINHYGIIFIIINIGVLGCTSSKLTVPISTVSNINNYNDNINNSNKTLRINKQRYYNFQKKSYVDTKYCVQQGDTLFRIASFTGHNYRDLAQWNNIIEPYKLNIGQILQINKAEIPAKNTNIYQILSKPKRKQSFNKDTTSRLYNQNTIPQNIKHSTILDNTVITDWRWPTNGKIIKKFSSTKNGNKGIDISGSLGQPILATASGKVVYVGNALQGYGNLIIIKHNNDYLSAYAHSDTLLVKEQKKVNAGQKIATMGNTGTNINKLHFEIRYKGTSVNPLHYLP